MRLQEACTTRRITACWLLLAVATVLLELSSNGASPWKSDATAWERPRVTPAASYFAADLASFRKFEK